LRSLRDGGNSEYCRSEQCDGGGRLGQGSDFQADFPRGSESFYPMDGILTTKDAFAYWRFIPVFRSRDTDVVWQGKTKGPIHGVANADPGSHEDLIHRKSVFAQLQGRFRIEQIKTIVRGSRKTQRLAEAAGSRRELVGSGASWNATIERHLVEVGYRFEGAQ
jgi:hypothetical protein